MLCSLSCLLCKIMLFALYNFLKIALVYIWLNRLLFFSRMEVNAWRQPSCTGRHLNYVLNWKTQCDTSLWWFLCCCTEFISDSLEWEKSIQCHVTTLFTVLVHIIILYAYIMHVFFCLSILDYLRISTSFIQGHKIASSETQIAQIFMPLDRVIQVRAYWFRSLQLSVCMFTCRI